jgi:hypothetical protein
VKIGFIILFGDENLLLVREAMFEGFKEEQILNRDWARRSYKRAFRSKQELDSFLGYIKIITEKNRNNFWEGEICLCPVEARR